MGGSGCFSETAAWSSAWLSSTLVSLKNWGLLIRSLDKTTRKWIDSKNTVYS